MNRKVHPLVFFALSVGCLGAAIAFFAVLYPCTYNQPDFGYSLGVMMLILIVCFTSLDGLAVAVIGAFVTRKWVGAFLVVGLLNAILLVGTPITFKLFYEGNRPLHETIRQIPEQSVAGYGPQVIAWRWPPIATFAILAAGGPSPEP